LTAEHVVLLRDGGFAWLTTGASDAGVQAAIAFGALMRTGELRSTLVPLEAGAPLSEHCALSLAGEGVLRACQNGDQGPYSLRWISRHASADWGTAPGAVVVSMSGDALTVAGRCDPTESDDGVTFCQYSRETQRWTEWRAERRAFLLAQRAHTALLTEPTEAGPKLVLYDILQGTRALLDTTDPTLELRAATLSEEGDRVLIVAQRAVRGGGVESMMGFARAGVPVTLRAMGMAAVDVAFADERRGMAIGAHANELAITTDGGISWTKVLPSEHPAPESVSLVPANDPRFRAATSAELRTRRLYPAGSLVRCNVSVCVAGRVVHRWQAE
jgi:hypothetical protein